MRPVRLLHVYPRFAAVPDAITARGLKLVAHFGGRAENFVLTTGQRADPLPPPFAKRMERVQGAPPVSGGFSVRRYRALADFMRGFHLVLSHERATLDLALARTLFAGQMRLPPVIHHEHGSALEAVREGRIARGYRMLALARVHRLIVPNDALAEHARRVWQQPAGRIALVEDPLADAGVAPSKPLAAPAEKALLARYMALYGEAMRRRDFGEWEE